MHEFEPGTYAILCGESWACYTPETGGLVVLTNVPADPAANGRWKIERSSKTKLYTIENVGTGSYIYTDKPGKELRLGPKPSEWHFKSSTDSDEAWHISIPDKDYIWTRTSDPSGPDVFRVSCHQLPSPRVGGPGLIIILIDGGGGGGGQFITAHSQGPDDQEIQFRKFGEDEE